jgi:hypothetical protein
VTVYLDTDVKEARWECDCEWFGVWGESGSGGSGGKSSLYVGIQDSPEPPESDGYSPPKDEGKGGCHDNDGRLS